MCFYSKLSKKAIELENRFKARIDQVELFEPKTVVNGFTFPNTPVITDTNPTRIQFYQWGLIPFWAKDNSIRKNTLNARIETLNEKPSFRSSVNKRCLVIADGFYEWQWKDKAGKKKQKYLISLPSEDLFAFAGIYSEWIDKNTGEQVFTYSIVTTQAHGLMVEIHNSKKRMPVILNPNNELVWLNGEDINAFVRPEVELQAVAI